MKPKSVKTKLPKGLKRIIILKRDENATLSGGVDRIVVEKKSKKKKQSKGLIGVVERLARRSAESSSLTADSYLSRHRRSNRKRRDGWLRDLGYNVLRSRRKGDKEIKLSKIFKW